MELITEKTRGFWKAISSILVERYDYFGGTCCISLNLKMVAPFTSETFVCINQIPITLQSDTDMNTFT
jgi:hypothetical protein